MVDGIQVEGLAALQRLFATAGPEVDRELRLTLREVAEPVKDDIERLAVAGIRRLGPRWGLMRIGVTRREVYIVPKQRGVKGRGDDRRRRPKFADLMEQRAMEPGLALNRDRVETAVEGLLEDFAVRWSA